MIKEKVSRASPVTGEGKVGRTDKATLTEWQGEACSFGIKILFRRKN